MMSSLHVPVESRPERDARWTRPTVAFIAWAIAVAVISVLVWLKPNSRTVYTVYSSAGSCWMNGLDVYSPLDGVMPYGYRYSPLVAVGFSALCQFPDQIGGILWRWLGVGAICFGFAAANRTIDPSRREKSERQRQWLWLFLLPFSAANLYNGQGNLHMVGLLLLGVAAFRNGYSNLAAACLAMACLLKVYPIALVMLLVVLFPQRLGYRVSTALAIGLALPFLAQLPVFVWHEYQMWLNVMIGDNRFSPETGTSYRDLSQLLHLIGVPINRSWFLAVQITLGLAAAASCLIAQRRLGWNSRRLISLAYGLGTFWMLLCGPATESSTYVVLAPLAAWLTVGALADEFTRSAKWLILTGFALVHFALFSSAFPFHGLIHGVGLHPLGTLVMLVGYLAAEFGIRKSAANVGSDGRLIAGVPVLSRSA